MEVDFKARELFGRPLAESIEIVEQFVTKSRAARDKKTEQVEFINFMLKMVGCQY